MGEGKKVEINLLNTKIEDNTKWLFSNNYEETAQSSNPKIVNRKEKQFHSILNISNHKELILKIKAKILTIGVNLQSVKYSKMKFILVI